MITTNEYQKAKAVIAQYESERATRVKALFKQAIAESGLIEDRPFSVKDITAVTGGICRAEFIVDVVYEN